MPDMERLLREVHLHVVEQRQGSHERDRLASYYKGLDRGRMEAAVIAAAIAVVWVVVRVFFPG